MPFWRYGLAPPPATSARVLVLWVPERFGGALGVHDLVQERDVDKGAEVLRVQADDAEQVA